MNKKDIKIKIPTNAKFVLDKLLENKYETFVCGGAVRDYILGLEPHDWDITTSATPQQAINIFRNNLNMNVIETGIKHGTVTVIINKEPVEITTFRKDGRYDDNRRPSDVIFVTDIIEDLSRRDFTINAMAYNDIDGLVDPFDGLQDIERKLIRCVGNPKDRFNEDGLRIMRAVRFATQLGFSIEKETKHYIYELMSNLNNISKERINSELCKIINNKYNIQLTEDIIKFIIPDLFSCISFKQNNPYHIFDLYTHIITSFYTAKSNNFDFVVKLTMLLHDIGKRNCFQDDKNGIRHFKGHAKNSEEIANKILRDLRFDTQTINDVCELIKFHDSEIVPNKNSVKRWLNKMGEPQLKRLLNVKFCDICAQNLEYFDERNNDIKLIRELIDNVIEENACISLKDLVINGNDIKEHLNIEQGKKIGTILNIILQMVIDEKLENNRNLLLFYLDSIKILFDDIEKELNKYQ